MPARIKNILLVLSLVQAAAIITAGFCGLKLPWAYSHETYAWQQQAIAQDLLNICLVLPVLVISAFALYQNSRLGLACYAGVQLYTVYTFVVYCFTIHFSGLFLLYCLILGLSFYTLVISVVYAIAAYKQPWVKSKWLRSTAAYFIAVSIMFYSLWLFDIVKCLLANSVPESIIEAGLFTNPVHVLDLAIVLPGITIAAAMSLKGNIVGIALMPVLLMFMLLMYTTIAFISIRLAGGAAPYAISACMFVLAGLSVLFLYKNARWYKINHVS